MIGENIKRIRESLSLGVNEAARKAGISGGYLSALERGEKQNPSMESLDKIAKALDVTVEDFFKDDASTNDEPVTIAAHHVGEDWTPEELEEIERFKEFVKSRRKQR